MTQNLVAAASDAEAEIARLRAEIDRLTGRLDRANDRADEYVLERDCARGELRALQNEHAAERRKPYRPDAKRIDAGDWTRASGQCVCDVCGCLYFEHAPVQGFEWMHRICDGRLVKL